MAVTLAGVICYLLFLHFRQTSESKGVYLNEYVCQVLNDTNRQWANNSMCEKTLFSYSLNVTTSLGNSRKCVGNTLQLCNVTQSLTVGQQLFCTNNVTSKFEECTIWSLNFTPIADYNFSHHRHNTTESQPAKQGTGLLIAAIVMFVLAILMCPFAFNGEFFLFFVVDFCLMFLILCLSLFLKNKLNSTEKFRMNV
ncbi:hypothetical protein RFI_04488 [Reticulomyxa filosa]|uniref:Uncharacterized protein n=1 Tax=Reticulomyxa filosa TaxID=46433 RepID=X6P3C4_RETFI|nr:hypothetical protein RFI_04488 [Reticulomyxa filosa]|eukprot:ETO32628.1 hypothetical protein RFI_04488 [Reticulomyxa filosa]